MFPAVRDSFLKDSGIRIPNAGLVNARLAEMGSGAYRPRCDFGRTFDHHFSAVFALHFGPFLRPRWRDDLPVYGRFLDLGC